MSDVTIVITGEDRASAELKEVVGNLEEAEEATESAAGASRDSADASSTNAKALKGVAAAAAVVGTAIAGLVQGVRMITDAWREQNEANRALMRGFRTIFNDADTVRVHFEALQPAINGLAHATMFSDEQFAQMAGTFMTATEGMRATAEDLELIADLAEATGMNAERSAQQYARALQGELSPRMARLIGLTTEQVQALNDIESATLRASEMQRVFSERVGGAARDVDPYLMALKNIEDAKGDLLQAIGKTLSENDSLVESLQRSEQSFRALQAAIEEGEFESLIDSISATIDGINELDEATRTITGALGGDGSGLIGTIVAVGDKALWFIPIIGQMRLGFNVLTAAAEKLNGMLDDHADASDNASSALNSYGGALQGAADKAVGFIAAQGGVLNALKGMAGDAIDPQFLAKITEGMEREADKWRGIIGQIEGGGKEVSAVDAEEAETGLEILQRLTNEVDSQAKRSAELVQMREDYYANERRIEALEKARNEIADARIAALQAEDSFERAKLERAAALRGLAERDLTDQERKLEQLRIEKQFRSDIDAARAESAQRAQQERQQAADDIRSIAGAFRQTGSQMAADVANVVDVFAKIEEGSASSLDAFQATGKAAASFAGQLGASAETQAGILATFETAMGLATLFTNPAESAAHFLAAANFGAIAAGVGQSAGAAGASSRGGAESGASSVQRSGSGRIAEQDRRRNEGRQGDVIHIDFSGATTFESAPRIQQAVSNGVSQAQDRQVRRQGR